jgi:hypothetical protein
VGETKESKMKNNDKASKTEERKAKYNMQEMVENKREK